MFRLTIIGDSGLHGTHYVTKRMTVGRTPECDIQLLDVTVSRAHCTVEDVLGQYVLVRDTGSRNGTYLNGKKIRGEAKAGPGAEITVGSFHLLLQDYLPESRKVDRQDITPARPREVPARLKIVR